MSEFKEVPVSEGFDSQSVGTCVKYADYPVYFLLAKRGDAMSIHISAKGRSGKMKTRAAALSVIDWIHTHYPTCKALIATVQKKSVYNLCSKVGFKDLGQANFERGQANIMVVTWDS